MGFVTRAPWPPPPPKPSHAHSNEQFDGGSVTRAALGSRKGARTSQCFCSPPPPPPCPLPRGPLSPTPCPHPNSPPHTQSTPHTPLHSPTSPLPSHTPALPPPALQAPRKCSSLPLRFPCASQGHATSPSQVEADPEAVPGFAGYDPPRAGQHGSYISRARKSYKGHNSEGNRFICDTEL